MDHAFIHPTPPSTLSAAPHGGLPGTHQDDYTQRCRRTPKYLAPSTHSTRVAPRIIRRRLPTHLIGARASEFTPPTAAIPAPVPVAAPAPPATAGLPPGTARQTERHATMMSRGVAPALHDRVTDYNPSNNNHSNYNSNLQQSSQQYQQHRYNNTNASSTLRTDTSLQTQQQQQQQTWRQQNAMLVAEAQRNGVDAAIDMLWTMSRDGDAVTQNFNQVVSLLASRGRFEDGLDLADQAGQRRMANIITFRPLMKLCCTLGDGRGAKRVWKVMSKWHIDGDMFLYAELMGALVRSQDMGSAYRILDSLIDAGRQPHIILYNTLMKEFARRADVESGFETLATIEKAGIQPDETTFNTLLNTCVRAMDVDGLQKAINLMNKHQVRPGTPTFNTILKLYSRKGKFDRALTIFEEMQQIVQPSIVTYNTLIDGCAHRGDMFRASIFFERMINNGFSPDICTLTSLLKGFGRANDPARAVQLFESMTEGGYRIEERTRYAAVNACLRGHDRDNARRFLHEMKAAGVAVRTRTWVWMLESDVSVGCEEGALETLRLMYSNGTYLDQNTKTNLVKEAREKTLSQLTRQLNAARTGDPRN